MRNLNYSTRIDCRTIYGYRCALKAVKQSDVLMYFVKVVHMVAAATANVLSSALICS